MSASAETMPLPPATAPDNDAPVDVRLNDGEFFLIRNLVARLAGIDLADSKKGLVSARLGRRLRALGLHTFRAYYDRVTSGGEEAERQLMVDLITTNETWFFREEKHFDLLQRDLIPRLSEVPKLAVWSAACSTGEEPYSVAMLLAEQRGIDSFSVLATDISNRVLEVARSAVYPLERAAKIPGRYLTRYCLKGVRSQQGKFTVEKALRERVEFRKMNLNGDWPEVGRFHIVLLRNAMIYFNGDTKRRLIERLARHLHPGGYLIVGHSETINGLHGGFATVVPSVYQLK